MRECGGKSSYPMNRAFSRVLLLSRSLDQDHPRGHEAYYHPTLTATFAQLPARLWNLQWPPAACPDLHRGWTQPAPERAQGCGWPDRRWEARLGVEKLVGVAWLE